MREPIVEITVDELLPTVQKMADEGQRFVIINCTDLGDKLDLLYHFDKDLKLTHFRLQVEKGSTIPSISGIYFAALVTENEIQDFFDVRFDGLAIDYKGKFIIIGKEILDQDSAEEMSGLSCRGASVSIIQKEKAKPRKEAEANG